MSFVCSQIPQGDIDSLPINFFINNLLSVVSLHSESKLECDNCDSGDPAINRCTTCCHFLCEFCSAGHKRGRSTKTHRVMSLEEAKEEGPIAVTRPSLCKEHEGEMLKLFCETCEEAICRDCTIVKHREHKYSFVKDAFLKEKATVSKFLSETKTKATTLKEAVDDISQMKRSVQSRAEETKEEAVLYVGELTKHLNLRCEKLVHCIEELKNAKLQSLEIQQEKLETALGSLQCSVQFTEKAFKNGSEVEFLNMCKQMSSRLQELNATKWQLEPCTDDAMKFKADKQLKQDVATFGVITEVVTHAATSTVTMGHGSEGVMYTTLCGQPIEFTIIAKERNGKKRTEGGDIFKAFFTQQGDVNVQLILLEINDCGNGTYTFCHTPNQTSHLQLSVLLMGDHVQGSPFTWPVVKWNLVIASTGNEGQVRLSEDKLTATFINKRSGPSYSGSRSYSPFEEPPYGNPNSQSSATGSWHAMAPTGLPSKRSSKQQWYVAGSRSFNVNKYSWKVKLTGSVSKGLSFGVIATSKASNGTVSVSTQGSWWVWSSKCKHLSSSSNVQTSSITNCASNDIIEMYLDYDKENLTMYKQRTKQSDIWDKVTKGVCPVFGMTTDGNQVSLQVQVTPIGRSERRWLDASFFFKN